MRKCIESDSKKNDGLEFSKKVVMWVPNADALYVSSCFQVLHMQGLTLKKKRFMLDEMPW